MKMIFFGGLCGVLMSNVFNPPLSYILSFTGGMVTGCIVYIIEINKQYKDDE